jgi:putative endopeptidase
LKRGAAVRRFGRLICALAALACAGAPSADTPLTELPHAPSFDAASLDHEADACVDFYRFACGGWERENPIPPDEGNWDVYGKLAADHRRLLWGLLRDASEPRDDREDAERLSGDYFTACMDETAIDAAGAAPLQPMLARIDALGSVRDIAALVASWHASGAADALFAFDSEQDHANATRVIAAIDIGGLGLPDREHYVRRDAAARALRADYRAHVARTFGLLGEAPTAAAASADAVLSIEVALAAAALPLNARLDPRNVYHRVRFDQLRRLAPSFDWGAYRDGIGLASGAVDVNVAQPALLRRLDSLLRARPLAQWRAYLRWRYVGAQSAYLARPFAQADFDFYATRLRGVEERPPRWKQCVRWTDRDLGEALGRLYVEHSFAPRTRERAEAMARRIGEAMRRRIEALPWMRETTRRAALRKLDTLVHRIGHPEQWRDYGALTVKRDDFHGNVARALGFDTQRRLRRIGQPLDRSEWWMTAPTVNAYYDAQLNTMNLPAGVLQPPLFDPRADDAPNYGNTGSTMGHELTHAFDDSGRRFDADGNLRDWWAPRDAAAFERRAGCLVAQYSSYDAADGIKVDGRRTLGENVADLGGALLAYDAWQAAGPATEAIDGFTPEQRFFVGVAQASCGHERPATQRLYALTGVHAPPRHRVNGVVANMPEFARAFACRPGQPMARRQPCSVW